MSLESSTESYPAFARIELGENLGKNLNQELARQQHLLEQDLHEIEDRLRDQEDKLHTQKLALEAEICNHDLHIRHWQLELRVKQSEDWNVGCGGRRKLSQGQASGQDKQQKVNIYFAIVIATMLVIGGVELNPGPINDTEKTSIKCGSCKKNLRVGVLCNGCEIWFHLGCQKIKRDQIIEETWVCRDCGTNSAKNELDTLRDEIKTTSEGPGRRKLMTATVEGKRKCGVRRHRGLDKAVPDGGHHHQRVVRRRDINWKKVGRANKAFEWVAEQLGTRYVDSNSWLDDRDFGRDGVHLNRRGTAAMGALFAREAATREDRNVFLIRPWDSFHSSQVLPRISDHNSVQLELNWLQTNFRIDITRKIWQYNKTDINGLQGYLIDQHNKFLDEDKNMDQVWENFKRILIEATSKYVPYKIVKSNSDPEYYTKYVRQLKKKARRAYNKRNVSLENYQKFKDLTKQLEREKKKAEANYLQNLLQEGENNWGRFYNYMRRRRGNRESIPVLRDANDQIITGDKQKADLLNSKCISIFNKKEREITIDESECTEMFEITAKDVQNRIKRLQNRKSRGPDDIPTEIIKLGGEAMIPYLMRIFNISINNCSIPDDWKSAIIIPIYKAGDKCDANNYRPSVSHQLSAK
ncbi:hypothetical protein ANN_03332 [Periplaneta americana]|uniref:Zinc finger PHD-type domain-containing protein n=1 Tax=Periplaneta americana TaxID=6978 RepID=A0ABQ8TYN8_PERAM|nr:hypothetical protein ANN_03332 [Periplaneta americana]